MKILNGVFTPLLVIAMLACMLLVGLINVNTQSSKQQSKSNENKSKSDDFLLVSIDANKLNSRIDEIRRHRNEKFDGWSWVRDTTTSEASTVIMNNDWQVGLPALPVKKSDAVVIGRVDTGKAFLSNDESGVYSEFSIRVNDWLKKPLNLTEGVDEEILAQRGGGRILYPSGNVVKYSISGQEMPRLNGKYVFFLTYDQQRSVFLILTAYEILNGVTHPLDGKGKSKVSGYKFSEYEGTNEKEFLKALDDELQKQTNVPSEVNNQ